MRIHATLQLHGKTATGISVPAAVVESLGAGKKPPVLVTFNGYMYRTTISFMHGEYLIPVAAEHRETARVSAGEELEVDIELDTEPRVVTVPDDFAAALDAEPAARKAFDGMSFTHRKEHVRAIESAKAEETRKRRIAKAVAMLRDGT
jgi:hypothetical protein